MMIFTVGHELNYRAAFAEHGVGNIYKIGRDSEVEHPFVDRHYKGGIVFQTEAAARAYATTDSAMSVYKVAADWVEDTYVADDGQHYLKHNALIFPLEMTNTDIARRILEVARAEETDYGATL